MSDDATMFLWIVLVFLFVCFCVWVANRNRPAREPKIPWTPEKAENDRLARETAKANRRTASAVQDDDDDDDDNTRRKRQERKEREDNEYLEAIVARHQEQLDEDDKQRQDWLDS